MTTKRFIVSLFVLFITFSAFFMGYSKADLFVYADSVPDGYTQVSTKDQMVQAFRAYCKSRNIVIDGSVLDAVTTATTDIYDKLCESLGIDLNALQSEIYYKTDDNNALQWYFTSTGISAYNRIFAEFLQNNDLEVGDSANEQDNTIYSGKYFADDNHNGCLCYIFQGNSTTPENNDILAYGTTFLYDWQNIASYGQSNHTYISPYKGYNYNIAVTYNSNNGGIYNINRSAIYMVNGNYKGQFTVAFNSTTEKLYFAIHFGTFAGAEVNRLLLKGEIANYTQVPCVIFLNTNNTVINNNNYQGDTIIYPDGTTNNDDPVNPTPDTNYNPYPDGGGTISPPSSGNGTGGSGNDGTLSLPDIDIDLPSIDWSLGDLSQKFPFSIPFDLVAFFTVLNAEPVAPSIDANIPLGDFYTWRFQADFSQFDNYAVIIRNVEFIGFCVGLIYLTIKLVKG